MERINGRVPILFHGADLKNCEAKKYGITGDTESLFITGPAGTGKTYLGVAMLKEWMYATVKERSSWSDEDKRRTSPPSWTWETVPELLLTLRGSFKDHSRYTEQEVIKDFSDPDLLILDDMGAEKSSEYSIQSLYLIIDRRYSSQSKTIITSNLSLGQIAEKVGDRIASRIAGMCRVIELRGKDRRVR